jgi:adenine phosphoribosyltransferase
MLTRVRELIRDVPDFPQPGVLFRDLTPVLADAGAYREVVDGLAELASRSGTADVVIGVEARGFVLGGAVARALGLGVIGVRKPGKLPVVAHRAEYSLEYGTATLELPHGVLHPGTRAFVVDDVLATGGTLAAACDLVERAGAAVVRLAVVVELADLNGRVKLRGRQLDALLTL